MPYLVFKIAAPSQQKPGYSQCLPAPSVKIKLIGVLCYFTILYPHMCFYFIHHPPAGFWKCIGSDPVAGAVFAINIDRIKFEWKIFCIPAKHFPHTRHFPSLQDSKYRIIEYWVRRVTSLHECIIQWLKCRIKIVDQLFVCIFQNVLFTGDCTNLVN